MQRALCEATATSATAWGAIARDDDYSRRHYSRADENEHAIAKLEDMLKTAGGESEHMATKKAISILKNA